MSLSALPLRSVTSQRRNMIMAIKFASRLITVSGAALGANVFLIRPWQRRWGATDEEVLRTLYLGLRSRSNRQRAYAPGLSFLRPERAVSVGQTGEQTDRLHLRTDRVLDDTQDAARHETASGAGQSPRNRTGQNRGEATKEWDRYQSRTSVVQKASQPWLYRGRGLYR
jgi:hypothetical protein